MGRDQAEPVSETFRVGVGAVVAAADGRVLALERSDIPGAWQLPQGGVERDEPLQEAVLRELQEETGLRHHELELLAEHPVFLGYELPQDARSPKTGRGQCHRWFLFRLHPGAEVTLPPGGEFGQHQWIRLNELADHAVDFRRPIYRELARHFAPALADPND
jgi:putative (di)nucleoside polyphosphate hydrolase